MEGGGGDWRAVGGGDCGGVRREGRGWVGGGLFAQGDGQSFCTLTGLDTAKKIAHLHTQKNAYILWRCLQGPCDKSVQKMIKATLIKGTYKTFFFNPYGP